MKAFLLYLLKKRGKCGAFLAGFTRKKHPTFLPFEKILINLPINRHAGTFSSIISYKTRLILEIPSRILSGVAFEKLIRIVFWPPPFE